MSLKKNPSVRGCGIFTQNKAHNIFNIILSIDKGYVALYYILDYDKYYKTYSDKPYIVVVVFISPVESTKAVKYFVYSATASHFLYFFCVGVFEVLSAL